MNKLLKSALLAGVSTMLMAGAVDVMAQGGGGGGGGGRGNFDPAQFQQMRLDRIKEAMGVTNEDEWKVISERLTKVFDAQQQAMTGRGMMGRGGRGGGGGMFGQPNPTMEALNTAIESGNPEQIKAKLTAFREDRTKKQATLKAAQDELKKVLNAKQEAVCVVQGVLE